MVTKSISTAQSHPAVSAEYVLIYAIAHCAHDTHVFDGKIFMKNRSEKKCANIFYECAPMMSCTRCTRLDDFRFGAFISLFAANIHNSSTISCDPMMVSTIFFSASFFSCLVFCTIITFGNVHASHVHWLLG